MSTIWKAFPFAYITFLSSCAFQRYEQVDSFEGIFEQLRFNVRATAIHSHQALREKGHPEKKESHFYFLLYAEMMKTFANYAICRKGEEEKKKHNVEKRNETEKIHANNQVKGKLSVSRSMTEFHFIVSGWKIANIKSASPQ